MVPPLLRWACVLIAAIVAAWQSAFDPVGAALAAAAALFLAAGHFRHGTVGWSFAALQKGDLATARRRLAGTPSTRWLSAESRTYRS